MMSRKKPREREWAAGPEQTHVPSAVDRPRRHLCVGWWCLLVYVALGLILEGLHGFKAALYLDLGNEVRRLLWTLAHAHGTLLALVNIAWGVTLRLASDPAAAGSATASRCLLTATVLLPAGFFLGGLSIEGGDPGPGVLLVPVGGLVLLVAVLLVALQVSRWR